MPPKKGTTSTSEDNSTTLGELKDLIIKVQTTLECKMDKLLSKINSLDERVINIEKEQQEQVKSLDFVYGELETIKSNYESLQADVLNIKSELPESDSKRVKDESNFSKMLEIKGIPETPKEDLQLLIQKLAICLTVECPAIDKIFRVGKKDGYKTGHRPILLKFVSTIERDNFLAKKKRLSSDDLGFKLTLASQVYINEHLPSSVRKLLGMTAVKRKEQDYKYLWTRNGRIFVRKSQNSDKIEILSQEDLLKL